MPAKGWKKPESRGTDQRIQIRLSASEYAAIKRAAKKAGARYLSTWMRDVALAAAEKLGIPRPS